MPGKPPPHGTRSKYVTGCRCPKCLQANREYKREYTLRKGTIDGRIPRKQTYYSSVHIRWDTRQIMRHRPTWDNTQWATTAGTTRRNWQRWIANGLPDDASDTLAVALGMHPVEVWPDWIDKASDLVRTHGSSCSTPGAHCPQREGTHGPH